MRAALSHSRICSVVRVSVVFTVHVLHQHFSTSLFQISNHLQPAIQIKFQVVIPAGPSAGHLACHQHAISLQAYLPKRLRGSMLKSGVLVTPQRATAGSSDCIRRLEAALRSRDEGSRPLGPHRKAAALEPARAQVATFAASEPMQAAAFEPARRVHLAQETGGAARAGDALHASIHSAPFNDF